MVDVDVGEQETSVGRGMEVGMWKKKGWDRVYCLLSRRRKELCRLPMSYDAAFVQCFDKRKEQDGKQQTLPENRIRGQLKSGSHGHRHAALHFTSSLGMDS
jgi:hypothetical protein